AEFGIQLERQIAGSSSPYYLQGVYGVLERTNDESEDPGGGCGTGWATGACVHQDLREEGRNAHDPVLQFLQDSTAFRRNVTSSACYAREALSAANPLASLGVGPRLLQISS